MLALCGSLLRHRELVLALAQRELFQGHSAHLLGRFWAIANPLIAVGTYFFVFRFIFPARLPGGAPAETFLLAGIIQWVAISDSLGKACTLMRNNTSLVKQISFPVEVLAGKSVLASLIVQFLMTAGLFFIALLGGDFGLETLGLWMLAVALQATFMLGTTLFLSALSPFFPDIGELVGVLLRLGIFITPILYGSSQFGPALEALFWTNPFSYFAWLHQQALTGRIEVLAWSGATALSFVAMIVGAKAFRLMSPAFNDAL